MGFAALLAANVDDLPPSMLYLRPLLMNQLAVLKSKGKKRCVWHQGVIEAASAMFLTSRAAYAQLLESCCGAWPAYERIRKIVAAAVTSSTGHDAAIYKAHGNATATWPEWAREVVLLYDTRSTWWGG